MSENRTTSLLLLAASFAALGALFELLRGRQSAEAATEPPEPAKPAPTPPPAPEPEPEPEPEVTIGQSAEP
jgi:hypothetical protein